MIAKMTGTKLRDEEKKTGEEDRPSEKLDGKAEAGKEGGGNKGSDSDRKASAKLEEKNL